MLAILNSKVACGPEELRAPHGQISSSPDIKKTSFDLFNSFQESFPHAVSLRIDDMTYMAYTGNTQSFLRPRSFAVKDDCFCLFEGTLQNLSNLRQEYGLSKSVSEVLLVIEAYRTLRDRAPYPATKVVGHLEGQFAFVLFDRSTQTIFTATDSDGKVPFYWGITADGCLAFSDTAQVLKGACGKSLASFPQGCLFSSKSGLQSYEDPRNKVKAIPTADEELCGTIFKVEREGFVPASII
uniref:TSA: Wollemia nobilis Ref_Wollemi_Transcript_16663_1065 transcribed RNA sequence n=1 Tax=Wollemia nobilis TaxID=56998 RepID=A0A0C9RIF7_9CONI